MASFNVIKLAPEDVPGAILSAEPEDCTVLALQRWLECRGMKKSGNKPELLDRVKLCMRME